MAGQPTSDGEDLKGLGTQFGGEIRSMDNEPKRRMVERLMDWLGTDSELHDDIQQKSISQIREPGTCEWLFESPEFQDWLTALESSTLWCHGILGAGKTVMTSLVIETLRNKFAMNEDVAIAFRYLGVDGHRDSLTDVLTEVIKQVIISEHGDLLRGRWYGLLDKRQKGNGSLVEMLCSIFYGRYRTVFVVLDGLDALGLEEKENLLACFDQVERHSGSTIKLLLTSRDTGKDVLKERRSFTRVEIRASNYDITLHVNSHIRSDLPFIAKEPVLQDYIKDVIVKLADGM